MKKVLLGLITIVGTLLFVSTAQAQVKDSNVQTKEQSAVKAVVNSYFKALNSSDATKVVSLFTPNGVLLAPGAPTATGSEQIKGTFQYVFDNFSYSLEVAIDNITVDGKHAYVSSTSKGSYVVKATNERVNDDYRETFVLKKEGNGWKIARYMYNQSK